MLGILRRFGLLDACARKAYLNIMTVREIIEVPDKRLKTVSAPLPEVTDETRALMDDMLETMYAANGIGLAAIQIAVPRRVIVMDISIPDSEDEAENGAGEAGEETGEEKRLRDMLKQEKPRFFVNPEITWTSEETRNYQEGCLSVPGFYDDVARPSKCRVKFLDYQGSEQEIECEGLLATCIQHEMDHLNGIVFLDHLSRLKRQMAMKKLKKAAQGASA